MRYILIILVFLSVGAKAQMVIKAHANYRPYALPAVNLLLDDYPNAAAAYSLRKLDKDYAGPAIRVRKDTTGQPEQDIGFTANGDLDTAALKDFAKTRSCFIARWYEQSGNDRLATRAEANMQPRIVNLGVIDRINNKPAIFWENTSNKRLTHTINNLSGTSVSFFGVYQATPPGTRYAKILSIGNDNGTDGFAVAPFANATVLDWQLNDYLTFGAGFNSGTAPRAISSGKQHPDGSQVLNSTFLGSATSQAYFNNTQIAYRVQSTGNTNLGNGNITIGNNNLSNQQANGYMQEIVIYTSNQSSNRTGIESNINTYYGIY